MIKKFMIAGLAALTLVAGNVMAEGKERVRVSVPVSYELGSTDGLSSPTETASGYGLEYIFSNGFGLGYSSYSTEIGGTVDLLSWEINEKTDTQFLDASYLFGEDLTFQLSLGAMIGGSGTLELNSATQDITLSGSSFGFAFGYTIGSLDLSYSYKSNSLTYSYETTSSLDSSSSQIFQSVGLGYVF